MGKMARVAALVVLCILSAVISGLWAGDKSSRVSVVNKNIVIEIDYGNVRPPRTIEVPWAKDVTALELLQAVAEVKTHPVDQYVFVVSIDGVEGKRGEMAWYYTVDGKSADKLAYSNVLGGDIKHVTWVYKKDVCSDKADGKI